MVNPDTILLINLCKIRGYKYYGENSATFGTGTQNVRRIDFPSSRYLSFPGN